MLIFFLFLLYTRKTTVVVTGTLLRQIETRIRKREREREREKDREKEGGRKSILIHFKYGKTRTREDI